MKGGSFGGTARRWAATLLLTLALVSSAKASDLSDAKNLLRSKSAADRREGVALLVSRVDSRAAIQALEEVLQRSRKAMKNLTKDLDKQDLELTRAVGFIRHLEQSGEYQLIPFAIDAYKKERAKWEALAAEMLRNLLVCKDVESALPKFDSSSAMGVRNPTQIFGCTAYGTRPRYSVYGTRPRYSSFGNEWGLRGPARERIHASPPSGPLRCVAPCRRPWPHRYCAETVVCVIATALRPGHAQPGDSGERDDRGG